MRRRFLIHSLVATTLVGCGNSSDSSKSNEQYFTLGEQYRTGKNKVLSPPLAFDNYRLGAQAGHLRSMFRIAWCLQWGFGTEKNFSGAFNWLMHAAQSGSGVALRLLADMYYNGIGCDQNYSESLRLYTLSSEAGDQESVVSISRQMELGQGLDKDDSFASEMLIRAVKGGNRFAYIKLLSKELDTLIQNLTDASATEQTGLFERIKKTSVKLLKSDTEDHYVLLNFPNQYIRAKVPAFDEVENEPESSYQVIKRLVKDKVSQAYEVAEMYLPRENCFDIKLQGAKAGLPNCMAYVGNCLLFGINVSKDVVEAKKWMSAAAVRNVPEALSNFGWMHHVGKMGNVDVNAAVKFYRQAEKLGDTKGIYLLGFCFEHGQGVVKDISQATVLYQRAAKAGYVPAQESLRRLGLRAVG